MNLKQLAGNKVSDSKKIKDGAGAGYEINSELSNFVVNSVTLKEEKVVDGEKFLICDCDIDCDAYIINVSSYMYGADIKESVSCKITSIVIEDAVEGEDLMEKVDNLLYDDAFEVEENYGGGYTRNSYDGTIAEIPSYLFREDHFWGNDNYPNGLIAFDANILDSEMISYIEKVAYGENFITSYVVFEDDSDIASFEDSSDAIEYADNYAKENPNHGYIEVRQENEEEFKNGDIDFVDSEIIYEIEEEEDYDEDDDEDDDEEEIGDSAKHISTQRKVSDSFNSDLCDAINVELMGLADGIEVSECNENRVLIETTSKLYSRYRDDIKDIMLDFDYAYNKSYPMKDKWIIDFRG